MEIPQELKQEVDRLIVKLKSDAPEIRWVRAANLHFTLRFLGDVEESDIPGLTELVNKHTENQTAFKIRLSGLGCFPNMKRPRVVWLGADGETDNFKQTAYKVESACREAGFGKGDKPFSPHLTIGRIKNSRGLEDFIKTLPDVKFTSEEFEVDHLVVFRSDLSPRGPRYTSLARVYLAK